jgi:ankyrin repeat protein
VPAFRGLQGFLSRLKRAAPGLPHKASNTIYILATPLHLASAPTSWARVSPQERAEIAHMLLEHGADINAQNKNGLTPFVLALQLGREEITDVLVQHGADPGAHDYANCIHSGVMDEYDVI